MPGIEKGRMVDQRNVAGARLLIYAAVRDQAMLEQGFYAAEAAGLRAHPKVAKVRLTNRLAAVAQADYDGLVSFFYSHSAAAALMARLRGRPVVVTGGAEQIFSNLAESSRQHLARITAFRMTAAAASAVLATSTSDLEQMNRVAWLGRSKLTLSYHGASAVDLQHPMTALSDRPAGSMVTICGLDTVLNVHRKGVPNALKLLARVRSECPDARLTIIGRTACRGIVEEQARALGVADGVVFAGYVSEEDKLALLRSHRYYIQLSVYEGFGIGALEALSQGCQVIHSGVGGLSDTIGGFGVALSPDAIGTFSLHSLPCYPGFSDPSLAHHLTKFGTASRAAAIYDALFKRNPHAVVTS